MDELDRNNGVWIRQALLYSKELNALYNSLHERLLDR